MTKTIWMVPALLGALSLPAAADVNVVPPGTQVVVRTNEYINSHRADGRVYTGTLDRDILDRDGRVAIRRGSQVELIARTYGSNELTLDLDSIRAHGRRYAIAASDANLSGGDRRDGVGANSRTGKFVGGGAIIGSIIGAIAGGGKGAAIGAAAGAASGAGAQMATRGREIRVPSESILTFRLERPIHVVTGPDRGYMRDGHHYHDYPEHP